MEPEKWLNYFHFSVKIWATFYLIVSHWGGGGGGGGGKGKINLRCRGELLDGEDNGCRKWAMIWMPNNLVLSVLTVSECVGWEWRKKWHIFESSVVVQWKQTNLKSSKKKSSCEKFDRKKVVFLCLKINFSARSCFLLKFQRHQ